ncbi:colanic acid/biofilm transcriptional regulator [Citrobacter amalonaticus]|uniref:Colanic acid/biofilm transcriptional regulator n=1 Tax=Citrobacter amalonaticus TaxID=35703 RepID=A0A2S4S0Z4_CITAM|nr:GntR family transcriptional regulator [Citrobacter amalonaticus]POT55287.1 colanic acid/biofilm transcriptional regulator [Citrobacter amalonaticus]POT77105.1 colanic acid/biofilm transcriptional regulator [Citrobacter amalonaticus]POU67557.1 colanic acid/biofilm transcriptional regulator [Citrobacter amalonaticus]POV07162.1 colanic acid/biofilm transcriptional regulator [Citrobacter amalonaticus]
MPGTEKTQHISLTSKVENGLKHKLSIGMLQPGARLITKNIAEELGISITPVREALLRLVSASALTIAPAQAFMVPEITQKTLTEIIQIRSELEGMAVMAAAEQMTAERVKILSGLLTEYRQVHENGTIEEYLQANRTFRFKIYHYANMPTLYDMIEQLCVRMGPGLHFLYGQSQPNVYQHSLEYYESLLCALERKNKEESRDCLVKIMNKHLAIIKQQYLN